jgi:hypothetical protein
MYNQTTEVIRQLTKENVKAMAHESAKWRTAPMSDAEKLMLEHSRQDSGTMERFLKLLDKLDAEYKKFNAETYKKQAMIMLSNRCIGKDLKGEPK